MSDTTTRRAAETSSRQQGDHPSGDNRFELVDKHLKRGRYAQDQLIETLHVAQDVFGFLSEDILIYEYGRVTFEDGFATSVVVLGQSPLDNAAIFTNRDRDFPSC